MKPEAHIGAPQDVSITPQQTMDGKGILHAATKCVILQRSGIGTVKRLFFLLSIAKRGEATTSNLIKETGYSRTSIVITARDLSQKGLLEIEVGGRGPHQNKYSLTAKGRRLIEAIIK